MVVPKEIAKILGGPGTLGRRITSLAGLDAAVRQGLPKATLRSVARHACATPGEQRNLVYSVVPEATYKRRRDRLTPAESERTERVARVVASAQHVWDDWQDTRVFLTTPHPALHGRTPLEAATSELGARQVELLLDRILYGLPA